MKKLTKIGTATFGLALGVTSLCAQPLSVCNVLADSATVNAYTLPAFVTEFSGYDLVKLPFATNGTEKVSPKVYTQNGVEIDDSDATDEQFTFAPTRSVYKVVYTLNGVDKTFTVNVNLVEPVLSIAESEIVPDYTVLDNAIELPYPTVLDADGEKLLNASGVAYTDEELRGKITITVTSPSGVVVTDTDAEGKIGTLVKDANTGVYTLTPKALGDYIVTYKFKSDNTLTGELTKTIKVSSTFKTERTIEYKLNSSIPTNVTLGVETTLPKVTVTDKTNDLTSIDAKVKITAKYIKADGTYSDVIEIKDYKFNPTVAGDYIITYEVEDYYGNKAQATNYVIRDVKDNKSPSNLTVVDAYDVSGDVTTDEFKEARVNVDYKIPSKIAKGTKITFPAMYAEDNVTGLKDLTFVRSVKVKYSSSSTSTTLSGEFNETTEYTFENAGTYVVTYSVTDKVGRTTSKTYEIVVSEGYTDSVAPKISFSSTLAKYYVAGDVIKFNKPTAIDYNDTENTTIGDARLNVLTYWYQGNDEANKTLLTAENGVCELTVPNVAGGTEITILTETQDTFGNVATDTKKFTVINDTTPSAIAMPVISSSYNQGDEVVLPEITISDVDGVDTIKNVSLEVYNKYGNKVSVQNVETETNVDKITVRNAKFTASFSGEYRILCVVTDMGENVSVATQKIEVTKTSVPVLKLDKESVDVSVGDTVDLNIFSVFDEGTVLDNPDVTISINGGVVAVDNTFTTNTEGRYEAEFKYTYAGGVLTQVLVINVSDEEAPTLEFTNGTPTLSFAETGKITLPSFDAKDKSGNVTLSVSATFKSSSSDDEELTVTDETNGYSFIADEEGTYEVVYKAVDQSGNEVTKPFTIVVGDKTGPVVEFDNDVFIPTTKKLNDVFAFDLRNAKVYDAIDEDVSYKDVKVKLTDPDGNKVSDNDADEYKYSFNLDQVGTYKITYSVSDSKGNLTTVSRDIEVKTDAVEPTEKSDVGMVLAIIASLAVLAGVIFYFFKPERSKIKEKSNKVDKKD